MQSQAIFVIIIPLLVLVPAFIVKIVLTRKRAARKPQVIRQMQTAVEQVIPQAKGYTVVLAQAEKDTMSILKEAGEDFTRQFAVAAVGAAGLMTFFLKGGTKFIVTIPTAGIAEISQAAEQKDFKAFCRNFSQVIND